MSDAKVPDVEVADVEGADAGRGPLPIERRRPHPDRLSPSAPGYDAILVAHDVAMAGGEAGYLDPITGLFVMTAAHHWARGSCCDSGCRHCPYLERVSA